MQISLVVFLVLLTFLTYRQPLHTFLFVFFYLLFLPIFRRYCSNLSLLFLAAVASPLNSSYYWVLFAGISIHTFFFLSFYYLLHPLYLFFSLFPACQVPQTTPSSRTRKVSTRAALRPTTTTSTIVSIIIMNLIWNPRLPMTMMPRHYVLGPAPGKRTRAWQMTLLWWRRSASCRSPPMMARAKKVATTTLFVPADLRWTSSTRQQIHCTSAPRSTNHQRNLPPRLLVLSKRSTNQALLSAISPIFCHWSWYCWSRCWWVRWLFRRPTSVVFRCSGFPFGWKSSG